MNKDRIKEIIDRLRDLPEENFCYDEVFRSDECGTVGCIAGWICEWYHLDVPEDNKLKAAEDFLGLSREDSYFGLCSKDAYLLFIANCGRAEREDAIKRLEWLLEHGTLEHYPFEKESYGVLGDQ